MTWLTQRLVQHHTMPVLARRTSYHTMESAKMHVVVLQRPSEGAGMRALENQDELLARLRRWLPEAEGFSIDSFIPGELHENPVWRTAERV